MNISAPCESPTPFQPSDINDECVRIVASLPDELREHYFGKGWHPRTNPSPFPFLISTVKPNGSVSNILRRPVSRQSEGANAKLFTTCGSKDICAYRSKAQLAIDLHGNNFPSAIWTCCRKICFATLAVEQSYPNTFEATLQIHQMALRLLSDVDNARTAVPTRLNGIGGSSLTHSAPTRARGSETMMNDRQKAMATFHKFCKNVMPWLLDLRDRESPVPSLPGGFCIASICCILSCTRKMIYGRRNVTALIEDDDANDPGSIIDQAGMRQRHFRRIGSRRGYPELSELPNFNCGCVTPCFANTPLTRLQNEYGHFSKLSQQLQPQAKENQYLLDDMFSPFTNSTVGTCNNALSALYTISESVIVDCRRVLQRLCNAAVDEDLVGANSQIVSRPHGMLAYRMANHPMNRLSDEMRFSVERYLDSFLRPDPAGTDGSVTCRVYSPEVNTQAKLRDLITESVGHDVRCDAIHSVTLQRMVNDYLRQRNARISFTQGDHNCCPNCKTLRYAILGFSLETKALQAPAESRGLPRPLTSEQYHEAQRAQEYLNVKLFQESEALEALRIHTERDARIRKVVKVWADFFRNVYKDDVKERQGGGFLPSGWRELRGRAVMVHQDAMNKVDLPSSVECATSDITRWRFDVNAQVSAVTGSASVFSHEQGTGPKNASEIFEIVLLDHLLTCKGEGVKIVISDNASVGKNWLTTVAMPQYFVDQGLCDVMLVLFLENNHGKYLADMIFGQFSTRRRRSNILGIDGLLTDFSKLNVRGEASIEGFALNPLSSINFSTVLSSLGYATSPPTDFAFKQRNIHFCAACAPGAKIRLPEEVRTMLGSSLPDDEGMVRLCTEPPTVISQEQLPFEDRYIDVPAKALDVDSRPVRPPVVAYQRSANSNGRTGSPSSSLAPLVVPLDKPLRSEWQRRSFKPHCSQGRLQWLSVSNTTRVCRASFFHAGHEVSTRPRGLAARHASVLFN